MLVRYSQGDSKSPYEYYFSALPIFSELLIR
ncbi:MAG: hypothetical protein ACJAT4_003299 [Granulosicoccus sp.]|jgi:hypothetical protein